MARSKTSRRADGAGFLYVILLPADPLDNASFDIIKIGVTNNWRRRMGEHRRRCVGQDQEWVVAYRVPRRFRLEKIVHERYKRMGTWLGYRKCDFCPRRHCELFCVNSCGGLLAVKRMIERYIVLLGWVIKRDTEPFFNMPTACSKLMHTDAERLSASGNLHSSFLHRGYIHLVEISTHGYIHTHGNIHGGHLHEWISPPMDISTHGYIHAWTYPHEWISPRWTYPASGYFHRGQNYAGG
ncbi:hypothetical protein C8F01DRAFT_1083645 [Mycena amicta]|nr:hypothetical protein C8F01DRAFT_1083645 [Mycena amicta]